MNAFNDPLEFVVGWEGAARKGLRVHSDVPL